MENLIVLEGYSPKGVALGAMRREYIETLVPLANHTTVTAGVRMTPPVTYEDEHDWFDRIAKRDGRDVILAILYKEDDKDYRYVGHTGIHNIAWPHGHGMTGTLIADASVHGRGVGTEAKLLLLHYGFRTLGLRKIYSTVKSFNGQSVGHLLKCGYKITGCRKGHWFHDGDFVDDIQLEVFRDDFEPIWEKYVYSRKLPELTRKQRAEAAKFVTK